MFFVHRLMSNLKHYNYRKHYNSHIFIRFCDLCHDDVLIQICTGIAYLVSFVRHVHTLLPLLFLQEYLNAKYIEQFYSGETLGDPDQDGDIDADEFLQKYQYDVTN